MTNTRNAGRWLVAFAATMGAGQVLTDVPDIGESNAQAVAFYSHGPGPAKTIIAFYLAAAAIVCLFGFLACVLPAVRAAGHRGSAAAGWAVGGGFAALYLAAAALFTLPTATTVLGFAPGPIDPYFARTSSMLGDGMLLLAAPMLLSVCLALVCRGAAKATALPSWVTRSGTIVAATLLLGWTWFPLPLLVLWAVGVGIMLSIRARTAPTPRSEAFPGTAASPPAGTRS